ncbi:nucleoid-associated protein [Leuconostoc litchii]|uniref:Nucleoid-associated protein n=1 Tax=Leuconostoc litchii TaxID=1981069 RepID=A0A6P2CJV9_9LACO|nr:nucleoid-associated protein [Leuconostoc litchii]TYC46125.1 nucleoid-associated protein [Leuconostoc litchii]
MIIQHAILHILDTNTGSLIASQGEMNVDNVGVHEYIEKLVAKIYRGDLKTGTLVSGSYLDNMLKQDNFPEMTTQLAAKLFDTISVSETIPAGDLLSFQATVDEGAIFGLIKLNFGARYAHAVEYENDEMVNNLVLNQSILPAATQTVDEAVIVNLAESSYQLLEKKQIIDGHRVSYFSENFLEIKPEISAKENIQTIKRTVKTIAEKYDEPEHEVLAITQDVIYNSLAETGSISTDVIAEKVFGDNVSAKQEYQEKVTEKKLPKEVSVVNADKYEKKYRVQKFKLDSGIEISIPINVYQDLSKVEFVNNPDGTVTLMIKDIETILNKFSV